MRIMGLLFFCFFLYQGQLIAQNLVYCYYDDDQDGFGDPNRRILNTSQLPCNLFNDLTPGNPNKWVSNNLDCDDTDKNINPNTWWYRDFDNDGYRNRTDSIQQCLRPAGGYKLRGELQPKDDEFIYNCVDGNSYRIYETFANTFDCDDLTPNTVRDFKDIWYLDNDKDGAVANLQQYFFSCNAPNDGKNYLKVSVLRFLPDRPIYLFCFLKQDCNDNNPLEKPDQGWYLDSDNDGFPLNNTPEFVQCTKPAGPYKTASQLISLSEDCNDLNPQVFPKIWYEDKDGDGLTTGNTLFSCNQPAGYIDLAGGVQLIDCDDTDKRATIVQRWYADLDGDKHGGNSITVCKPPAGYFTQFELLSINDCNDNDNKIYPNAPELCDGKDNNCNGLTDELACCPPGNILFVNAAATGANNGTSWANAFTKLQDGLELARRCPSVTAIWVARGVYYPDEGYGITNNDRTATFTGRNNLLVLGGFAGNELLPSQRRMENIPETILNGDILKNGDFRASYNVVRIDGLDATFRLDGFTIINGNASSPADPLDYQRSGAGMLVLNGSPTIDNCYFRGNTALRGSAIANLGGSALFTNCVISGNNRVSTTRGVVYNSSASPTFLHCTIAANNVGSDIFYNDLNVSAKVNNCIIRGATPAISGPGSTLATTSIIQSATVWLGANNSNADPLFVNEAGGNLRLRPCSPAIDAGQSALGLAFDLDGVSRPTGNGPDKGAYEYGNPKRILFVNAAAPAGGNGVSWSTALRSLQDALITQYCPAIDEIWVARGTYTPTTTTNRDAAFVMRNNLAIYGGFVGTETQLSQRNWRLNETILSGDIGVSGNRSDNSQNVISNDNNGLNATAILDGFIIRDGQYDKSGSTKKGGGGMLNVNSSPWVSNCIFVGNFSSSDGGAVFNDGASAAPTFINCIFSGNQGVFGGGIYNAVARTQVINCTFSSNQGAAGAGMFSTGIPPGNPRATVRNSIVWGNTDGILNASYVSQPSHIEVSNSLVQGGYPGSGNSSQNPLFMAPAGIGLGQLGDLRLQPCSPAINNGLNSALPAGTTADLAGQSRILLNTVDMGAYELQGDMPPQIIYVNAAATGTRTGQSWANAFTSLQSALAQNCFGNIQIWVARGTYRPASNTNRDSAFVMRNNLAIYGGFAGTETQLNQRNWRLNETILSGDIGVVGNTDDNSFSVVRGNGLNASAIIDGFTISGGNANATGTIDGVIHTMNGGGVHLQNSSPTISNCTITSNSARVNGGAIHNITGSPAIRNCIFSDNQAQWGGAIYNEINASPAIINSVFYGNRGVSQGGALFNNGSSNPTIINTTFTGNSANQGVALANQFSSVPVVTNSILWETNNLIHLIHAPAPTITYSIVQGGFPGTGNLNADPLFIRMEVFNIGFRNTDLRLLSCSPAINAGSNAALPSGTTTDLAGMPRTALTTVDMGAYERQSIGAPQVIYVDETATGNNDGTSWANAYRTLQAAAKDLNNCATGSTPTINIARGSYLINSIFINFDKVSARIIGGFPNGGGTRNAATNPVIIRGGTVRVLKSVTMDGVRVER